MGLDHHKEAVEALCRDSFNNLGTTLGLDCQLEFNGILNFDSQNLPPELQGFVPAVDDWQNHVLNFITWRDLVDWAWELIKAIWDHFFGE